MGRVTESEVLSTWRLRDEVMRFLATDTFNGAHEMALWKMCTISMFRSKRFGLSKSNFSFPIHWHLFWKRSYAFQWLYFGVVVVWEVWKTNIIGQYGLLYVGTFAQFSASTLARTHTRSEGIINRSCFSGTYGDSCTAWRVCSIYIQDRRWPKLNEFEFLTCMLMNSYFWNV